MLAHFKDVIVSSYLHSDGTGGSRGPKGHDPIIPKVRYGCWGSLLLVSVMYICKTCFRPCNTWSFTFIITCQNAPKYAISRHKIQKIFWGGDCILPQYFPPVGRGKCGEGETRVGRTPHTLPPSAPTVPQSSCLRHLASPLKNARSATVSQELHTNLADTTLSCFLLLCLMLLFTCVRRLQWVKVRRRSRCSFCRNVLQMANGCVSRTYTW